MKNCRHSRRRRRTGMGVEVLKALAEREGAFGLHFDLQMGRRVLQETWAHDA